MLDIFSKNLVEFISGMPLTLTCFDYGPQSKSMRERDSEAPAHKNKKSTKLKKKIVLKSSDTYAKKSCHRLFLRGGVCRSFSRKSLTFVNVLVFEM